MELLMISADKLKLILSQEDMDAYRLDAGTIGSGAGTRRAIRTILDEAKRRCGFDACGGRLLVQMFPSAAGGCEIFVTRLFTADADGTDGADPSSARAYLFDRIGDLLDCCAALDRSGYGEPSAAYSCDSGGYLLIVCGDWDTPGEYGRRLDTGKAEIYIGEHTKKIRGRDAVAVLAALR
ncbi:MAG: adaptor protein MecA [Clostridia bacterium]|nr:adaptor protein MecA [Clostridia bacterium]